VLAERSKRATGPVGRGFGLMMRKSLPEGGGLIIQPCNSVTSCFMRFHIDVLFIGRDSLVRHVVAGMRPWRFSRIVRGSKLVIELPAGTISSSGTALGDEVEIHPQ
jgi:uncharacterized membrane protein (UPF0127 family)